MSINKKISLIDVANTSIIPSSMMEKKERKKPKRSRKSCITCGKRFLGVTKAISCSKKCANTYQYNKAKLKAQKPKNDESISSNPIRKSWKRKYTKRMNFKGEHLCIMSSNDLNQIKSIVKIVKMLHKDIRTTIHSINL